VSLINHARVGTDVSAGSHASVFSDGAAYEATLGAAHRHYIRVKARRLARTLRTHRPDAREILDLGCGTGEMVQALPENRYQVTGVDLSEAMIAHAKAKALPRTRFLTRDAARTGLPDASYDAVFATALFHHVPPAERGAVAREMHRLVRPGGLAIVFEHNPKNPITRRIVRDCEVDQGVVLAPADQMRSLLDLAGFEFLHARYLVFFPRWLALLSRVEPALGWLPLGGQYMLTARRPNREKA
jgi:SAM-dependent methyltransferase